MILFTRRVWGFRLIDVIGVGLLIALILSVYLAKTFAGRERGEIARVESEIATEHNRVRLLQAEVAHLERPDRNAACGVDLEFGRLAHWHTFRR